MQQGYNIALDNAKGSVEALQIAIGSRSAADSDKLPQ
jgi:hypothetical protein